MKQILWIFSISLFIPITYYYYCNSKNFIIYFIANVRFKGVLSSPCTIHNIFDEQRMNCSRAPEFYHNLKQRNIESQYKFGCLSITPITFLLKLLISLVFKYKLIRINNLNSECYLSISLGHFPVSWLLIIIIIVYCYVAPLYFGILIDIDIEINSFGTSCSRFIYL